MALRVQSEYAQLKRVMLHRPGAEIDKILPHNYRNLLFEDIPYLEDMRAEHDAFVEELERQGAQCVFVEDFLLEVLQKEKIRENFVSDILELERCEFLFENIMKLSPEEILNIGIAGLTVEEAQTKGFSIPDKIAVFPEYDIIPPIPNLYFMRDQAAVIGNCVILSQMRSPSRVREAILVRYVYKHHPDFTLGGSTTYIESPFYIEGGDIMVINEDSVAIGYSERTSSRSIKNIATKIFEHSNFTRVYDVELPKNRDYMHLDTVFTIIDNKRAAAYLDVMGEIRETRMYERTIVDGRVKAKLTPRTAHPFMETLREEGFEIIPIGAGSKAHAAREQRSDGANLLAVAPGRVFAYRRNKITNRDLKARGIDVIEIEGAELVRGLGGPRCMTQPLERD